MKQLLILLLFICNIISYAQNATQLYETGKKLYDKEKYVDAFAKLESAAEQGHIKAQYRIGRMYAKGKGVKKDNKKAVYWYEKAAIQGHTKSQYYLGKCYMKGKGIKEDKNKAKEFILKAVNNKKNGKEILKELKKDAKEGDNDAKAILQLIGQDK